MKETDPLYEQKMRELSKLMMNNKFYYLKDGSKRSGEMIFHEDNFMQFRGKNGSWELINLQEFTIKFNEKEFKYKFNDSQTEAVLIDPIRTPQSKIIIQSDLDKEKDDISQHICYNEFQYCKNGVNPNGDFMF
jgi:hypothetical protein